MSFAIAPVVGLAAVLGGVVLANAQDLRSYQVEAWFQQGSFSRRFDAFLQLDWSRSPAVTGRLCLPDGSERRVSGSNPTDGKLQLTFDGSFTLTRGWSLRSVTLERSQMTRDNVNIIAWDAPISVNRRGDSNRQFGIFRPSANADWSHFGSFDPYSGDNVGLVSSNASDPQDFSLSNFDRHSRESFFNFILTNQLYVGDGGWDPGKLHLAFRLDRLPDLLRWMSGQPDRITFDPPISPNTCGAEAIFATLSVPPLLEFFYARRLQTSGLVLGAYPVALGAGPGMKFVATRDPGITRVFFDEGRSLEARDQVVRVKIVDTIRDFVTQRRPNFLRDGRIEPLDASQAFAIRMNLVGPSLTSCDARRWERLQFQALLTSTPTQANTITLMIQIQEGHFAPGRQLPSDARFNENRIDDGALESLQALMAGFFIDRGFSYEDDDAVRRTTLFTCR